MQPVQPSFTGFTRVLPKDQILQTKIFAPFDYRTSPLCNPGPCRIPVST